MMPASLGQPLTPAEIRVLEFVAQGYTAVGIAARTSRSRRTIESQYLTAREKLGARTISEAVVIALQRGLIVGQPGKPHKGEIASDG